MNSGKDLEVRYQARDLVCWQKGDAKDHKNLRTPSCGDHNCEGDHGGWIIAVNWSDHRGGESVAELEGIWK